MNKINKYKILHNYLPKTLRIAHICGSLIVYVYVCVCELSLHSSLSVQLLFREDNEYSV